MKKIQNFVSDECKKKLQINLIENVPIFQVTHKEILNIDYNLKKNCRHNCDIRRLKFCLATLTHNFLGDASCHTKHTHFLKAQKRAPQIRLQSDKQSRDIFCKMHNRQDLHEFKAYLRGFKAEKQQQ